MRSKTITIFIDCAADKTYDFVSNLENLPKWATAFAKSIKRMDGEWILETEQGSLRVRMTERNKLGVLDHYISPSPGMELYVPMRVVPSGKGSEVIFTLFQTPEMSDDRFAKDINLVGQDLDSLKRVMERQFP